MVRDGPASENQHRNGLTAFPDFFQFLVESAVFFGVLGQISRIRISSSSLAASYAIVLALFPGLAAFVAF